MPGFFENEETDMAPVDDEEQWEPVQRPSRPPVSASASLQTGLSSGGSASPSKAASKKPKSTAVSVPPKECQTSYECPVCARTLETDNDGFNSHIDFCLSRGAIREAQSEASSTPSRAQKPPSSGKGKRKRTIFDKI